MSYSIVGFCDQWDTFERRDFALMTRLAKSVDIERIIYVQPPLTLTSLVKFIFGKADVYATFGWKHCFSYGPIHKRGKIVIVHSFSILPFFGSSVLRQLNIRVMDLARINIVKIIMMKNRIRNNVVLWISNPYFNSNLIGKFRETLVCYNLCEDYIEKHFSPAQRKLLEIEDEIITKKADLLFMASEELCKNKERINKNVILIPNGVDYCGMRNGQKCAPPSEIGGIPSPIIGHIGLLGERTDFSLIKYLAINHSDWSFVFVGPLSGKPKLYEEVRNLFNVYFLGGKAAREIPRYVNYFNVCAFFYSLNYGNKAGNSMKLYLYLASGKPIVSYSVGGAQDIPEHLIYLAHTPDEFEEKIERALHEHGNEKGAERLIYAERNSWDKRVEIIDQAINQQIGKQE